MNYSKNLKPIASNYDNENNSKDLLQSQIRKLLWMGGQTRPDIAFDVCQLGTNFKYSDDKDVKYVNKIIAHLKQEPVQITYENLGNECNLKLSIFEDAPHGNLSDRGSQLGYLIMLVGDDGKCSFLNWQSKVVS